MCTSLEQRIREAERSLDFAFYGFREQPELLEALVEAQRRGVAIRGVVDREVDGTNAYADTDAWSVALGGLGDDRAVDLATRAARPSFVGAKERCPRPAGTRGPLQCSAFDLGDRCWLGSAAAAEPLVYRGDIMHDKVLVADGRYVWTGSTNASDSCAGGYNANLVLSIDSPTLAAWYSSELTQMFDGRFHRSKRRQGPMRVRLADDLAVEVLFSPQHDPLDSAVVPWVQRSGRSIDVAVFFLTHSGVTQALIDAHRRGVEVRVLLDATGAANAYSKHEALRAAGIPVKVEDFGGKLHTKAAVIDGSVLVAGSMNWTNAGTDENDENTLILHSRHLSAQFSGWFDELWRTVPERWLVGRPDPESRDSGSACTDGADNDYDGAIDEADPGCGRARSSLVDSVGRVAPKVDGRCSW